MIRQRKRFKTLMQIDKEFKALIPPLTKEEYEQLEQNVIAHGCRDPLCVWNDTLVDGHNRYEICEKHSLAYGTEDTINLVDREAVLLWIK